MGLPLQKTDQHFCYGDYREWPDDERWELIDGVAWNMCAAPTLQHQNMVVELNRQIANFLVGKPCKVFSSPVDVLLTNDPEQDEDAIDTVVQPDVLVVCDRRKLNNKNIHGAPDWIIEILSPSTSRKDQREKFDIYERFAVQEYWILNPANKSLHAFRLDPVTKTYADPQILVGSGKIASTVLSGLVIDTDIVFADM